MTYDKSKTYIILGGDLKSWKDLENGKRLYFYLKDIKPEENLVSFYYDKEDASILGQIDFEEGVCLPEDQMIEFSKKFDYENFKGGEGDYCAWAVGSFTKITPLTIEDLGDLDHTISLGEDQAREFLKLIKDNFQGRQDLEQEVKFLLDQENFERIYGDFVKEKNPKRQINYYFDPSGLVGDQSTTIRIRKKEDKYTLTIKEKKSDSKDLSTEKSAPISEKDFEKIMEAGKVRLDSHIKNSLVGEVPYMGSLETIRDEVKYENILLAFDKSTYFDKTDYEIEMEGRQDKLADLIKTMGLEDRDFNEVSKFGRFIGEYKKRK